MSCSNDDDTEHTKEQRTVQINMGDVEQRRYNTIDVSSEFQQGAEISPEASHINQIPPGEDRSLLSVSVEEQNTELLKRQTLQRLFHLINDHLSQWEMTTVDDLCLEPSHVEHLMEVSMLCKDVLKDSESGTSSMKETIDDRVLEDSVIKILRHSCQIPGLIEQITDRLYQGTQRKKNLLRFLQSLLKLHAGTNTESLSVACSNETANVPSKDTDTSEASTRSDSSIPSCLIDEDRNNLTMINETTKLKPEASINTGNGCTEEEYESKTPFKRSCEAKLCGVQNCKGKYRKRRFTDKMGLRSYNRFNKQYRCFQCSASFSYRPSLRNHVRFVHSKREKTVKWMDITK